LTGIEKKLMPMFISGKYWLNEVLISESQRGNGHVDRATKAPLKG